MAITKIQTGGIPALAVTHDKLHTTMDLSGKTVTLPTLTALDVTNNIVVGGTVDGIDIAARDAVLTSTTTTAGAALPKAGGTMTGALVVNTASNGLPSVSLSHSNASADNFLITAGVPGTSNAGFSIRDIDAAANRLVIDTNGNVGIGTASPSFGAGGFGLELAGAAGAGRPTIRIKDTVTNNALQLSATATAAILESRSSGMSLVLGTSGVEKFRIDDSSGYLVSQHQSQVRLVLGSVGNSNTNSSNWIRGNASYLQYNSAASGHTWEIAGVERMRIDSSGRVTTPNQARVFAQGNINNWVIMLQIRSTPHGKRLERTDLIRLV